MQAEGHVVLITKFLMKWMDRIASCVHAQYFFPLWPLNSYTKFMEFSSMKNTYHQNIFVFRNSMLSTETSAHCSGNWTIEFLRLIPQSLSVMSNSSTTCCFFLAVNFTVSFCVAFYWGFGRIFNQCVLCQNQEACMRCFFTPNHHF